jgi:hypothetical protein
MTLRPYATESRGMAALRMLHPTEPVQAVGREALSRFASIPLGKLLSGEVKAQLGDGTFLVEVADTAIRMLLSKGQRAGDRLQLTLLARSPQLTFLLRSMPLADVTFLSSAGEVLAKILDTSHDFAARPSLVGTAPIVAESGAPPTQIGRGLQERLSASGLFCASHLAEWASGTRSIESLTREPQQQMNGDSPASSASTDLADRYAPELARLMALQLDALDQSRISWRGELWPGQSMQWEVAKRSAHQDPGGKHREPCETASIWTTVIHLDLPALGHLTARLQIRELQMHISIDTTELWATIRLSTRSGELARILTVLGLLTEAIEVNHICPTTRQA